MCSSLRRAKMVHPVHCPALRRCRAIKRRTVLGSAFRSKVIAGRSPPRQSFLRPAQAGSLNLPKEVSSSLSKRIRGHKGVALRKRRMARSNWLCEDCLAATPKRIRPAQVVDHILPLALGGLDVDSNTRNLCDPCHEKRTAEQFGRDAKPDRDTEGWPIWPKQGRGS